MQPFISVAICTRDRARHLTAALDALRPAIERCRGRVDVEVLVVDNGSSDATAAVAASNANMLPLRYVVEPTPGLSHARNRACREARGNYIAWIDDDVVVGAEWLTAYADAIQRHPDAAFFGGPIRLRFEGRPPGWLSDASLEIEHIYSAFDLGRQARRIERRRDLPFGANYVVRQREQRLVNYDTQLGRQPGSPWLAGEESAALGALLDSGAWGWWGYRRPALSTSSHAAARPCATCWHTATAWAERMPAASRSRRGRRRCWDGPAGSGLVWPAAFCTPSRSDSPPTLEPGRRPCMPLRTSPAGSGITADAMLRSLRPASQG